MRWGIQEHAADDHSTVDLCLQELDQCCRLSLATSCVILLSHRYGGRMLPARIKQSIFEALANVLSIGDNAYINQFYQLDKNPLEHVYVLRSIDPAAKKEWKASEVQLQQILRCASDLCIQMKAISEDERNEFHVSGKFLCKGF
ncbi:unnamed protein product [Rotaria sp. Silwood2]|nr:unnamed protein product [Rotaria sp. Silwood2]CAF4323157.1 unnamed protein product [Rotaria sp. Silwood2]CAF4337168.1 unnamed protein product [Rotaria sp. Silwood2]